ncbi:MAG TPA: ATP-binding cassette domain-containing protein [Solirubrobacteraceae bacterium]
MEIHGLSAGYGGTEVIRGLSLAVGAGEVVALLGPNGAGKSTTLRAVSGLVRASAGSIMLDGIDIVGKRPSEIARLGVAHVAESHAVFSGLTVDEHFRTRPRGEQLDIELAWELFPALKKLRSRRVGTLSGGERQMLALARALTRRPGLLLLDELSLGLAPVVVERLLPIVADVATQNECGVVLVEQHVDLGLEIADRGYVLAHGELVLKGDAEHLRTNRALLAASYLGEQAGDDGLPTELRVGHLQPG